jgi:hypothetical protein
MLGGIDLSRHSNTDTAPEAPKAAYTRLRALPPPALEAELRGAWAGLASGITLDFGAAGPAPEILLEEIAIPPVGNPELSRQTVLRLSAAIPRGARTLRIGWAAAYGPLVVRQMGMPEGEAYTGFLTEGALSPPFSLGAPGGGPLPVLGAALAVALGLLALVLPSPRLPAVAGRLGAYGGALAACAVPMALLAIAPPGGGDAGAALAALAVAVAGLAGVRGPGRGGAGIAAVVGLLQAPWLALAVQGGAPPLAANLAPLFAAATLLALAATAALLAAGGRLQAAPGYRRRIALPGLVACGALAAGQAASVMLAG